MMDTHSLESVCLSYFLVALMFLAIGSFMTFTGSDRCFAWSGVGFLSTVSIGCVLILLNGIIKD